MAIANQLNAATTPISVSEGGSGLSTATTAYAPICAGNTATASFNVASTGLSNSGWVLTSNGSSATPSFQAPAVGTVTSVSGTASRITSTGGATPVIDISASYVGQSSITTLGTIGSGTWNGTTIAVANGGTGVATMTTAYAPVISGTTATGALQVASTGLSTAGWVLTSNGSSAIPSFQAPAVGTVTSVSGTLNRISSTGGATPVIDIDAAYVGQSSITTLGTVSTGTWSATTITPSKGGTGVANTGTITVGGNTAFSGAFAFTGTITGTTTVTFPTSGTLQTTSGASGTVNSGTANQIAYYATTTNAVSGLTGANGSVLVTDNTGVPSMLANPSATGRVLQSANGAIPAWSTSTYPASTTVNRILYSSSTNVVGEITTANSSILVTNGSGAPSLSTTIPFTVPVTTGGTGVATLTTAYAPVCAGTTATGALQVASTGLSTSGFVLTSTGSSSLPTFQAIPASGGATLIRVPMTLAQFQAINTTPFQIIAAQGANTIIIPSSLVIELNLAGVAFGGGGPAGFQFGNSAGFTGPLLATFAATVITTPTLPSVITIPINYANPNVVPRTFTKSNCVNTGVFIASSGSFFSGGTGATVVVSIVYSVITTT